MKECVCICYQGDTQGGSTDLGVGTWFLILSLRRALRDLGQMASVPVPSFPDLQAWISTFIQTREAAAEDKSPPEEQGMGGGGTSSPGTWGGQNGCENQPARLPLMGDEGKAGLELPLWKQKSW